MIKELTPEKCVILLEKTGCSDNVIKHSKCVRDIAVKIASLAKADIKTIELGALLHDIGRSKTHGIDHAIEGAKIGKKIGLSAKLIKIIERHIGAGITKETAKKFGLPAKNYVPITLEEKIVCHADNLINNCKTQKIEYEIEKAIINEQKEYALRLVKLHHELSKKCGIDLNNIEYISTRKK
jgi:uncharacterized protein (TIGR00295 family)